MNKRLLSLMLCAVMLLIGSLALAETNPNAGMGLFTGTAEPGAITIEASSQDRMNPLKQTYIDEFSISRHLWDNLVKLSPEDNSIAPAAAESWESSEDGMTWTFHLRQGAKWVNSNGDPVADVTANDFVFAWGELLNPANACQYAEYALIFKNAQAYYDYVSGVEGAEEVTLDQVGFRAEDDYTLVCELENYLPYFLQYIKFEVMAPVYEPFYNDIGADNYGTGPDTLLFNGPFYMSERVLENHVTAMKNPEWWDADNVQVQKINFIKQTDNNALLNAFMGGEVDVIDMNDGDMTAALQAYGYQTSNLSSGSSIIFWTVDSDPNRDISNANLRRAISAAIDRTALINTVYKNGNVPSTNFTYGISGVNTPTFGEVVVAANGGESLYSPVADVDKAKEYLALALEELGKTADQVDVTMMISAGPVNELAAVVFQEQVRNALGIELKIDVMQLAEARARRNEKNYDMFYGNWIPDYNDPMTNLELFVTGFGNNHPGYSNPDYDALIAQARKELDPVAREQLFVQCEFKIAEDMIVIPICWSYNDYAVSEKITEGYNRSAFQDLNFIYAKLAK